MEWWLFLPITSHSWELKGSLCWRKRKSVSVCSTGWLCSSFTSCLGARLHSGLGSSVWSLSIENSTSEHRQPRYTKEVCVLLLMCPAYTDYMLSTVRALPWAGACVRVQRTWGSPSSPQGRESARLWRKLSCISLFPCIRGTPLGLYTNMYNRC